MRSPNRKRIIRRLSIAILGGALVATLFTAAPAQAAVAGCNSNTSTGAIVYQITPPGSFTRYISVKVCGLYDINSARNSTAVYCRTGTGAGCDIRAEVKNARLDIYENGSYSRTVADDYFAANVSGYSSGWSWQGTDVTSSYAGWPCLGYSIRANDYTINVRFGFDGVLRKVASVVSSNIFSPDCQP